MTYQGKPLQPNTLVQNQFLVLRHQLYIANCNTGHVENSGSNDKKQQNAVRQSDVSGLPGKHLLPQRWWLAVISSSHLYRVKFRYTLCGLHRLILYRLALPVYDDMFTLFKLLSVFNPLLNSPTRPLVLWRCWLGGRKGIRPVKNWVVGYWRGYLSERGAELHMAQLMPLPLTVSCFSKIQIGFTFLALAHLGSPGKRAVKRVCVCVCVC